MIAPLSTVLQRIGKVRPSVTIHSGYAKMKIVRNIFLTVFLGLSSTVVHGALTTDTIEPAGSFAIVSNSQYNASLSGLQGVANGQSFIAPVSFDVARISLVKGTTQTYSSGNQLRLHLFSWNPTNDASDVTEWRKGDGTADGDPLDETGMTPLFSQAFDLPAGVISEGDFLPFDPETNVVDDGFGVHVLAEHLCVVLDAVEARHVRIATRVAPSRGVAVVCLDVRGGGPPDLDFERATVDQQLAVVLQRARFRGEAHGDRLRRKTEFDLSVVT